MKLIHQCFYSTCLCVLALPAYSQQTLWYSGDTTGPSTYANGVGITGPGVPFFLIYQDFAVPAPGWHITSVFGNDYFTIGSFSTFATWEIRSGMPAGNGGAIVASGDAAITRTATGRTSSSGSLALTEFKTQLDGLSLDLPPGHYWLAVTPDDNDNWSPLSSETSGANCIGTPCGNSGNAFLENQTMLPSTFPASSVNFSMGVIGTVAQNPIPPVLCQANAGTPFLARAEGITELVGDILLNCSGGTPTPAGQPVPTSTFEVSLNTTITSRLLDQSTGLSEAMLMIDEPNPGSAAAVPNNTVVLPPAGSPPQMICATAAGCAETGTGGSPSPYQTQPNVFLGEQSGTGTIIWNNVPIDPPGPNVNRTIRITNLRANASQLPLSTTLIPTAITATVSDLSLNIVSPTQTVAYIQPGVIASGTNASIPQCGSHNASLIGGTGTPAFDFNLTASERFASSSFKRRDYGLTADGPTAPQLFAQNVPGFPYNTESGFYAPALFSVGSRAGLADFGTRIRVTFSNVGAGARIFVPTSFPLTTNGSTSTPPGPQPPVPAGIANAQMQLVQTDQYGNSASPGYTSVPAIATVQGSPVAEVNYSGNTAYAVYEIVNSDPNAPEVATIPVAVAFNVTGSLPALGWVNVNISEAPDGGPLAGIPLADTTAPIPRFADTSVPQPAYTIVPCLVPISVTTNPPGLQVIVDGVTLTSPQNLNWTPGTTHTIAVTSSQGNSSSRHIFQNWTGGLPQSFQITAPTSADTFTANFDTEYFLTMNAGAGGTVSPSSGWFNAGQTVAISATPASGSSFAGWTGTGSGSFTGAVNNSSVTINGPITESASFGGAPPSAVSVSPNAGSGSAQTFAFTFSDPGGATNIASTQIDINSKLTVTGACYFYYARGSNAIYLASDTGVWQGPQTIGVAGTLQNSQCTVDAGASSSAASGNALTLNLALGFKAAFAGPKNIYMEVQDATADSGWSLHGTWTVSGSVESSSPPAPLSVTPNMGSGASENFEFAFSDPNGVADISSVQIDINAQLAVAGACYVYFVPNSLAIYLADDTGAWQGPMTVGRVGILQNSQCVVDAGNSAILGAGTNTTLTVILAVSFNPAFVGTKNVYMEVQNRAQDSGWALKGTWTVTSVPTPDFSISMSAGPGSITASSSAQYTVTVTAINGFNGTVTFGVSGLPSGVTGSFTFTSEPGSSSNTLTIATTAGASPGTFPITVTGTSGSLQHSASASLTITGTSSGPPVPASVTPNAGTGLRHAECR
jgi:hypothetical protein